MKDTLERIEKIVKHLKEKYKERIIFDECVMENDEAVIMGRLDEKEFCMAYTEHELFTIYVLEEDEDLLDKEFTPIVNRHIGIKEHFGYKKTIEGKKYNVLEWDTISFEKRKRYHLSRSPLESFCFYTGSSGTLCHSPSMLAYDHDAIFVPLPKEQQLTEKTLIALERRIARSVRLNEERWALPPEDDEDAFPPCMDERIVYVKK